MSEENSTPVAVSASSIASATSESNEGTSSPSFNDPTRYSKFITGLIIILILIGVLLGVTALTSQATFLAIVNAFWLVLFCTVLIFLILGVLVMVGLKDQVKQVLDIFVEGTLTIVDVMNFIKMAGNFIVQVFKQVVLFLVPIFAYAIAAAIYFGLLVAYKWVGKSYDVTLFTIVLAALLTLAVGFLNKPIKEEIQEGEPSWGKKVQNRFRDLFGDAIEVILFVFFLTMDSTKLFFLPSNLGSVELHAAFEKYDFMIRGWHLDQSLRTTLNLVMLAVALEIVRFIMRIIVAGLTFYKDVNSVIGDTNKNMSGSSQIKWALRQSFEVHKDDVIRFITYTTFIVFVFLAFPRLKLLAMVVASATSLLLDIGMRNRLVIKRGHDLFSKLVSGLFRV